MLFLATEETLKREIKEELGIRVNDRDITLINIYKSNDKKIDILDIILL